MADGPRRLGSLCARVRRREGHLAVCRRRRRAQSAPVTVRSTGQVNALVKTGPVQGPSVAWTVTDHCVAARSTVVLPDDSEATRDVLVVLSTSVVPRSSEYRYVAPAGPVSEKPATETSRLSWDEAPLHV